MAAAFVRISVSPEGNIEKIEEAERLLPLDSSQRVVAFSHRGKIQRHIFRRITAADWESFFSHVLVELKRVKNGVEQTIDTDTAALLLYGRTIENVEGFTAPDGREPKSLPSWPECVHQKFRLRAIKTLMSACQTVSDSDELFLEAEGITVRLDALWNADENGAMSSYSGLVHRFACPSAEQQRRFMRAKNRAYVVGGSRAGTTVLASSHALLVKLYDELIQGVAGYSWAGKPLTHDAKEDAAREMDALHKSVAVGCVFQTTIAEAQNEDE